MDSPEKAQQYIDNIRQLGATFDRLAGSFRKDLGTPAFSFDKYCANDWRRAVYGDALIRLCQLTENNFHFIETLGLLAVTRYVFELSIWLRLFGKDIRYCLVYYSELLKTQLRYYKDSLSHLRREIALLQELQAEDDRVTRELARSFSQGHVPAKKAGQLAHDAMSRVDAKASRFFALYLDDAKKNGYGYQAFLVEKRALPEFENAIAEIDAQLQEFGKHAPQDVRRLADRKWKWREMAEKAGILHEHDYIYSFASKLLHATPASITTDKKNLEVDEVVVFVRYIYVKMLEIIDLAHAQPECAIKAAS